MFKILLKVTAMVSAASAALAVLLSVKKTEKQYEECLEEGVDLSYFEIFKYNLNNSIFLKISKIIFSELIDLAGKLYRYKTMMCLVVLTLAGGQFGIIPPLAMVELSKVFILTDLILTIIFSMLKLIVDEVNVEPENTEQA